VVLFAKCFSCHEVSKTSITLHEIIIYDHLLIHEVFEGKLPKSKLDDHMHIFPIPMCAWSNFE
jgi:hypothetical protein